MYDQRYISNDRDMAWLSLCPCPKLGCKTKTLSK